MSNNFNVSILTKKGQKTKKLTISDTSCVLGIRFQLCWRQWTRISTASSAIFIRNIKEYYYNNNFLNQISNYLIKQLKKLWSIAFMEKSLYINF